MFPESVKGIWWRPVILYLLIKQRKNGRCYYHAQLHERSHPLFKTALNFLSIQGLDLANFLGKIQTQICMQQLLHHSINQLDYIKSSCDKRAIYLLININCNVLKISVFM